jgi:tricarballylate dehydrogenase
MSEYGFVVVGDGNLGFAVAFTFEGMRITTEGAVIGVDDTPIPGRYAVGEMVGDLFYFDYPGGSGFCADAVFGKIAGARAGAYAKAR